MRRLLRSVRWFFVTLTVIVVTSFTVDATLNEGSISQSALGILVTGVTEASCAEGMQELQIAERRICIDLYEASPNEECFFAVVKNNEETKRNIGISACTPSSVAGAKPWTYVSYHEAKALCAKRQMRLPTHEEWYTAALGTQESGCNIGSGAVAETGDSVCESSYGAYDMIGNVWEWVDGEVVDGVYNSRQLPETGRVENADKYGVAISTSEQKNNTFDNDYFWSSKDGVYGMMRGGFYGSGEDGGIYSIQATRPYTFSGAALGFRCVEEL
jgi:formylglycine-generating enzyme required for sulfatase activity